ncbi:hypothetical protein K438DRAFT_1927758 [Mycena galopus ATCC 62051]|nr:hypothetical protein K438DRAFT_1927758 [Mycena galopus ATCC 62051]
MAWRFSEIWPKCISTRIRRLTKADLLAWVLKRGAIVRAQLGKMRCPAMILAESLQPPTDGKFDMERPATLESTRPQASTAGHQWCKRIYWIRDEEGIVERASSFMSMLDAKSIRRNSRFGSRAKLIASRTHKTRKIRSFDGLKEGAIGFQPQSDMWQSILNTASRDMSKGQRLSFSHSWTSLEWSLRGSRTIMLTRADSIGVLQQEMSNGGGAGVLKRKKGRWLFQTFFNAVSSSGPRQRGGYGCVDEVQ